MAFSVAVPTNDEAAEAKIAAAYANDPGASPTGRYVPTDEAIKDSINFPNIRFLVVGNKHVCADPIEDFYPSPTNNNSALPVAHSWQKPSPASIGVGKVSAPLYLQWMLMQATGCYGRQWARRNVCCLLLLGTRVAHHAEDSHRAYSLKLWWLSS